MKSFKQYITEKPHKIGVMDKYADPKFREIRGLLSPSMDDLISFTKHKTKWKSVRIIAGLGAKGLYVWDANEATHPDVMGGENLNPDKYKTGMLSLEKQGEYLDEPYWLLELGKNAADAKRIAKQHIALKDLMKEFDDTKLDGFYGA